MNSPDGIEPLPKREDGATPFYKPKTVYPGVPVPPADTERDVVDVHNAREAEADDRRMLTSLRKIDDVDAKLWRLQERVSAGENERQALSAEISGLRAALARNTRGDNMVKWFTIATIVVLMLGLGGIAIWAALSSPT